MIRILILYLVFTSSGFALYQAGAQVHLPNVSKIYIASPYRTGSTLLYASTQFLFEKPEQNFVKKFHHISNLTPILKSCPKVHVILTIRNPYDAFSSLLKTRQGALTDDQILHYLKQNNALFLQAKLLSKQKTNKRILILRYENFNENFLFALNQINAFLSANMSRQLMISTRDKFSRKNVKKFISTLGSFDNWDSKTQFHGNHISKSNKTWEEITPPHLHKKIRKELQPIISLPLHPNHLAPTFLPTLL